MSCAQHIIVFLLLLTKISLFARPAGASRLIRRELGSFKSQVLYSRFLWTLGDSEPSKQHSYPRNLTLQRLRPMSVRMASTGDHEGEASRAAYSGVASNTSRRRKGGDKLGHGVGTHCEGLDRSEFDETLDLVALRIPAKLCTEFLRELKELIFSRARMKRIFNDNGEGRENKRLVLLKPEIKLEDFKKSDDGRVQQRHIDYVTRHGGELVQFSLKLGYDNLGLMKY